MRSVFFGLSLAAALATPARADLKTFALAQKIAPVIASEKGCGLALDQSAIEAWIEQNVPSGAMEFTNELNMLIRSNSREVDAMGASQKTAHCAQVRRVAKTFGLIK